MAESRKKHEAPDTDAVGDLELDKDLDPIDAHRMRNMGPRERLRQAQELAGVPQEHRAVMGGVTGDTDDPLRHAEPGATEGPTVSAGVTPGADHELVFGEPPDARRERLAREAEGRGA